jgi:hypothetical protein
VAGLHERSLTDHIGMAQAICFVSIGSLVLECLVRTLPIIKSSLIPRDNDFFRFKRGIVIKWNSVWPEFSAR